MFREVLKIVVLSICICTITLSCKGRMSKSEALKESLAEFNTVNNITTRIYHPLDYSEKTVDTLMSNGYHVVLKTYTDLDNSIVKSIKKNEISENHHFRIIEGNIRVKLKKKVLLDVVINRDFINHQLDILDSDWKDYNLSDVWINQSASLDNNLLAIQIEFYSVLTEMNRRFNLQINDVGETYLREIDKTNY